MPKQVLLLTALGFLGAPDAPADSLEANASRPAASGIELAAATPPARAPLPGVQAAAPRDKRPKELFGRFRGRKKRPGPGGWPPGPRCYTTSTLLDQEGPRECYGQVISSIHSSASTA